MTASDINRFVILDRVTIAGVQSWYLVWELAGDEKFCDSKRSVTLNVVILNGFDCIRNITSPIAPLTAGRTAARRLSV